MEKTTTICGEITLNNSHFIINDGIRKINLSDILSNMLSEFVGEDYTIGINISLVATKSPKS